MPDATITSTASNFGTISGTFSADQSTVTGTISGVITGTLTGSVGVPGPAGPAGIGIPSGGLEGQVLLKASDTSYDTAWYDNYAATLQATVRNETGATLSKGTVVYISGGAGNKPLVTKASASSESSSSKTFAILAQDIPNNQNGQAVTMGLLKGLNTTSFTAGDNLWLSTTAGQIVSPTPPASPAHAVFLGNVVRVHATQGEIEVRIQNGYELGELHDVLLDTPANGQVLKYDSAQGLWINGNALTSVAWGDISGTLSNQTDLQTALNGKYSTSNPAGYITSSALTGYATESWVASQGYLTSSSLTPYLTKADNLGSLTNFSTARSNLSLGTLDTPVFAGVTAQGSGSNVANLTPTSLTLTHTTSGSFVIQPSSGITFPDSSVQTTAFTTAQLSAYLAKASNLSDLPSASTARTNLGLGSLAVVNDAPSDGNQYARKNGAWDVVTATSSYISSVSSPLSVTSGNLTIDLSAYLTSATAASTYQTQAAMSSYLTTSAAASTYAALSGATDLGTYTWSAPMSSNSVQVNSTSISLNGSSSITLGSTGVITFGDTTQQTTAYPGSSGFLLKADNLSGLASTSTARTNLGLGTMATETAADYSTTTVANGLYYPLSSNPSSYLVAADIAGKANSANAALTGNVTITTNSTGAALFIEQSGTGNILTLHDQASDTTFVAIDQNGKINTIPSTTANAGFNLPHGSGPTSPVNGDIWTTTSGFFARVNGGTAQFPALSGTNTFTGTCTFSASTGSFVTGTATGTISVGTGATLNGSTKTVNIGTGGVAGSTTNIAIGSTTGTSTTTLQGSTVGVTLAADTNTTGLATTAFVVGQAGSATPIVNGTAAVGTSLRYARQDHVHPTDTTRAPLASPTFTGVPAAPTATPGTNTTQIATTAFVQAAVSAGSGAVWGSITGTLSSQTDLQSALDAKLSTATAASTYAPLASPTFTGTVTIPSGASISGYATTASLSSYAPLASPALTGTPTAPTAAVDTNTTQVATTAYVVGQGYLKSATASSTYAPLASPALTGTPTAPTATAGTNTTQIATTAFVTAAIPTNSVKAWVNFNGTGTVAIRASLNVSSITDNGTGDYTMNLTSALTDVNFASVIGTTDDNAAASYGYEKGTAGQYRTTTAFRFYIFGGALRDNTGVYVALFR